MVKYTEHCDLCEKEFNNDKNGFTAEIGYSLGGWGRRSDFIPKTSIEVCDKCFKELKQETLNLSKKIQELKHKKHLNK